MDSSLTMLLVAAIINIATIVGSAYGKLWLKPFVIISSLAVVWFGFQWQSWLGAIGAYIAVLIIIGILRSTILKPSLDKRQKGNGNAS